MSGWPASPPTQPRQPARAGRRFDPRLWETMTARASHWLTGHDPMLHTPAALRNLPYRRCVYVPLIQHVDGYAVDYVGSAVRVRPGAAWQRVVGEHQRRHLDRRRDWSRIAVAGLRDDTPIVAVRLIEAAIADLVGRPPRCVALPTLPPDWRTRIADLPPEPADRAIGVGTTLRSAG